MQEALARVSPKHRDSARNLVHYLALRVHDLRPLQEQLAWLGLPSFGRPVRILMDLGGPKIRTSDVAHRPAFLRMRPQKDEYGRPFRPYRLGLQSNRSTPGGWEVDGCIGIVLKIETLKGFEKLPERMLAALAGDCAGVMIARGDLAVECGYERLAEVQDESLWCAEAAHVPVIWATQVLETLAKTGVPSRAEISDAGLGAARLERR